MSQTRRDLEKRARNAILQEAFFRVESAITLALVLILAVIFSPYWWMFPILGILIEGFIAFRTLRNPKINAKAVAHIFDQEFQPKTIKSRGLRDRLNKAMEYLQQVETAVLQTKEGPMRDRLKRTTDEMIDWVGGVYQLATRLDAYHHDSLIEQDLKSVPQAIKDLRRRLAEADDPRVKRQIEETIRDREEQYTTLQRLDGTMQNAELLIERNLSDMGRVYSQVLLMSSLKETSGQGEDLQGEISERVHELDDLLAAMDEFHSGRSNTQHQVFEYSET